MRGCKRRIRYIVDFNHLETLRIGLYQVIPESDCALPMRFNHSLADSAPCISKRFVKIPYVSVNAQPMEPGSSPMYSFEVLRMNLQSNKPLLI